MNLPKVERLGPHKWVLLEDWQTPFALIPKGFVTDGASVPRWLWWFASPAGDLFEAAIIHDYFYCHAIGNKQQADLIFYRAAMFYGVNQHKAQLAYYAVCIGGKGKY